MDRRNTLNTLLGRNSPISTNTKKKISLQELTSPTDTELEPFSQYDSDYFYDQK